MLELKDFFHLPELDTLFEQLVSDRPGLIIVSGLDPRQAVSGSGAINGFLPSGRAGIFSILARRLLATSDPARTVILAEAGDILRLPTGLRRRVRMVQNKTPTASAAEVEALLAEKLQLLILDRLTPETATLACQAALAGPRVLAQLDCVFAGGALARYLVDLGVPREFHAALTWAIAVQRVPRLCSQCRESATLGPTRLAELQHHHPHLSTDAKFYRAGAGCSSCGGSGRSGDVAIFDVLRVPEGTGDADQWLGLSSLLSQQEYLLQLALLGQVAIEDLDHFEAELLRRTYHLLGASERALAEANAELTLRLAELEAAQRVMRQRTESLIALQGIAQTLISSVELDDLAERICRHVHKLIDVDRSVLYVLRPEGTAEIVGTGGWPPGLRHTRLDAFRVFEETGDPGNRAGDGEQAGPTRFPGWPPGVPQQHSDIAGARLQAGLRVLLVSQHEVVGLLIVHSTRKQHFAAGEVALLQALANQAAVALQRTGLIQALRAKIAELQAAQAELVQKERLERELELARQVQQSLLPRDFPQVPGYVCAAQNQTARRVGGDFYDAFLLGDRHLALVIADVSDKGMPAALFMALTRSLLLAEAQRDLSPSRVLNNVHRLLLRLGDPEMFVTAFYGVVDTATGRLTYVRAGHEEPVLVRRGDTRLLGGQGILLGILDSGTLPLEEEQVDLQAGDRLVLYTDGITDALAPDGQPYGIDRLRDFLAQRGHLAPAGLCSATFDELSIYQGNADQFDDMAMLVLAVEDAQ